MLLAIILLFIIGDPVQFHAQREVEYCVVQDCSVIEMRTYGRLESVGVYPIVKQDIYVVDGDFTPGNIYGGYYAGDHIRFITFGELRWFPAGYRVALPLVAR
jgi:hypothetical protein